MEEGVSSQQTLQSAVAKWLIPQEKGRDEITKGTATMLEIDLQVCGTVEDKRFREFTDHLQPLPQHQTTFFVTVIPEPYESTVEKVKRETHGDIEASLSL